MEETDGRLANNFSGGLDISESKIQDSRFFVANNENIADHNSVNGIQVPTQAREELIKGNEGICALHVFSIVWPKRIMQQSQCINLF